MSRSLARVRAALEAAGIDAELREMAHGTRSAEDAARAVGCEIDRIAKSVVLRGAASGEALLFVAAGGRTVAPEAAAAAGEPMERADAAFVRERTGFAIGGVAPIAHRRLPRAFRDPRLDDFPTVWAAGTPRHVFEIAPGTLLGPCGAIPAPAAFRGM